MVRRKLGITTIPMSRVMALQKLQLLTTSVMNSLSKRSESHHLEHMPSPHEPPLDMGAMLHCDMVAVLADRRGRIARNMLYVI